MSDCAVSCTTTLLLCYCAVRLLLETKKLTCIHLEAVTMRYYFAITIISKPEKKGKKSHLSFVLAGNLEEEIKLEISNFGNNSAHIERIGRM